jgi:hypothetical protein
VKNVIVNDTFVPIAFFKSERTSIAGIGSTYKIDQLLYEDSGIGSDVQGDNLKASAYGLFTSYDFTEQWSVFGLMAGITLTGDAEFEYVNLGGYYGWLCATSTHSLEIERR